MAKIDSYILTADVSEAEIRENLVNLEAGGQLHMGADMPLDLAILAVSSMQAETNLVLSPDYPIEDAALLIPALPAGVRVFLDAPTHPDLIKQVASSLVPGSILELSSELSIDSFSAAARSLAVGAVLTLNQYTSQEQSIAVAENIPLTERQAICMSNSLPAERRLAVNLKIYQRFVYQNLIIASFELPQPTVERSFQTRDRVSFESFFNLELGPGSDFYSNMLESYPDDAIQFLDYLIERLTQTDFVVNERFEKLLEQLDPQHILKDFEGTIEKTLPHVVMTPEECSSLKDFALQFLFDLREEIDPVNCPGITF